RHRRRWPSGLHPRPDHRARAPLRRPLVAHRARARLRAHLHPPDRRSGHGDRGGHRPLPVLRGGAAGAAGPRRRRGQLGVRLPLAEHRPPVPHRPGGHPMTVQSTTPPADATGTSRVALVVRGGWDGHQPVEATDMFIPFLERSGFSVRIEDSPAIYADAEYMATVDLIVQCNTMSTIERAQFEGLRAAIEAGTGMAGWHGGIADSYRNESDYLTLIGGQFGCHPGKHPDERTGEQSDNYVPHTVNMLPEAASHPITTGISDFDLVTEQYWVLADDYIDVLATTTQKVREWDPWHREITSPAIWTRQWGKGRIFVATPGRRVEVLEDPNVRTVIERGMLWAARGSGQPYGDHGGRGAEEATR